MVRPVRIELAVPYRTLPTFKCMRPNTLKGLPERLNGPKPTVGAGRGVSNAD